MPNAIRRTRLSRQIRWRTVHQRTDDLAVRRHHAAISLQHFKRRDIMGKYLLAWLLGVPAIVLVLIYLIF